MTVARSRSRTPRRRSHLNRCEEAASGTTLQVVAHTLSGQEIPLTIQANQPLQVACSAVADILGTSHGQIEFLHGNHVIELEKNAVMAGLTDGSEICVIIRPPLKVLIALDTCTAMIFNADSGQSEVCFSHTAKVTSATCSVDGTQILTASYDRTARVFDAESGECRKVLQHNTSVTSAVFSPDGQSVITSPLDKTARIFSSFDTPARVDRVFHFAGQKCDIHSVAFSPDGRFALAAPRSEVIWFLNVATGAAEKAITLRGKVNTAIFSPCGKRVLIASSDRVAKLVDIDTEECLQTFSGHRAGVTMATFSPDGNEVLTASSDGTAKVFDAHSGVCRCTISKFGGSLQAARFSSDGRRILTLDSNRMRMFSSRSGRLERELSAPAGSRVLDAVFVP